MSSVLGGSDKIIPLQKFTGKLLGWMRKKNDLNSFITLKF